MENGIHINAVELYFLLTVAGVLLSIVSLFLSSVLKEVKANTAATISLDKSVSGEMIRINTVQASHAEELKNFDHVFERLRKAEDGILTLQGKIK
jgi:hypothetical protein